MIDKLITTNNFEKYNKKSNPSSNTNNDSKKLKQINSNSIKFKTNSNYSTFLPITKHNQDFQSSVLTIERRLAQVRGNLQDEQYEKYMLQLGGNFSQSEAKSQVGIHSQFMVNINHNLKRNFKLLLQTKVKNDIEELRIIQNDFLVYINDQKDFLDDLIKKTCYELQHILRRIKTPQISTVNTELAQQLIIKNKLISNLQGNIVLHNQQQLKLKKQLIETKLLLQKQQQKNEKIKKINNKKIYQQFCNNCKILQIKNITLEQQNIKLQKKLQNIKINNQKLQQYIFDLEQKLVGVEIQIEKRLKQHIENINNNHQKSIPISNPSLSIQKYDNLQIMRKLNDQNAALQQKCERLQKNIIKQHDLNQIQKQFKQRYINFQRKQTQFYQSLTNFQKQKQLLYQRQHQIFLNQQNLNNRILQLNKKQQQLLALQSNILHNKEINNKNLLLLPSIQRQINKQSYNQQFDINSFGKINNQGIVHNFRQPTYSAYQKLQSNNVFIPQLPLNKHQDQNLFHHQQRIINREIRQPTSSLFNKSKPSDSYSKIIRWQDKDSKVSIQRINSPKNYRESSKNSRASVSKSIKYTHNSSMNIDRQRQRKPPQNLGNKLQKLRQQIKREIQSIK